MNTDRTYTSFAGNRLIATGLLDQALLATKKRMDDSDTEPILIFDDRTGAQVDFDLRGTPEEILARLATHPLFATTPDSGTTHRGPGRPKLGVVCREVSLLPRHWDWLGAQRGGASATLRRLVDEARKRASGSDTPRLAREAAGKFMWAMAGNLPGFEEASRALYAGDYDQLADLTDQWPKDVRDYLFRLAGHPAPVK